VAVHVRSDPHHKGLWMWLVRPDSGIPGFKGRILRSLNIKKPRRLTGEQRPEVERRKRGGRVTAEKILAFADRFAAGMRPGSHSSQHSELYADDGVPR
jgi:hypothetical protein